ncbi:flagellar biosynthesis protein FlhF [Anaerosalibacter sp. Marseille-P3206]|uniref:flagellar biosynthesis protein FlhF n=1 Tax=Anaerosalibacter sp. Marseille-P3206 TaxID=1871005 RepID=UPI001F406922|nr:flagellar biosynthesis protein FlhF [Anaerosalibacter sp. Marseille-P3206]
MKVKKYVGANTQEAMNKLKKELGSEAIILNTRVIKQKGFFNFFKKPLVEVTAAIEDKYLKSTDDKTANIDEINHELRKLRSLVEEVAVNVNSDEQTFNSNLEVYRDKLVSNGVDYNIATSILDNINVQINLKDKTKEEIQKIICYNIKEHIGNAEPLDLTDAPKIIFFVGPTGVGKTTTLAKIAAQLVIKDNYKIGLITADTYRIAAVEQLRTYSEILKLPLKIIYKPDEIYKAMAEFNDKDIILVDTAGRSHKDKTLINETKVLMNTVKNKEVYLVLSVTTDFLTMSSIVEQYNFIDDLKVIFTKLDEAETYGNILNTMFKHRCKLSYFTMGQDVPDDIKIANPDEIVKHLMGEN